MIRDLQIIKNSELLFQKKCIIWGAGQKGRMLYKNLIKIGMLKGSIYFCDSNAEQINESEYKILSIDEMSDMVMTDKTKYIIIISVASIEIQDEILECIKQFNLFDVDICTLYGITYAILFEGRKRGVKFLQKDFGLINSSEEIRSLKETITKLKYFIIAPYQKQMILLYQQGKVGSQTIHSSMKNYGMYSLHVHTLRDMECIREILKSERGKIISLVRNPLEQKISQFWQLFEHLCFDWSDVNFSELQERFWSNFQDNVFSWFDNEMKDVIGIDIFDYPFNKECGYTIIKEDDIELLLMTTEKLNQLTDVIGDFVGIENFKIMSKNIGERKAYRFAYSEYKKEFVISKNIFESIVNDEHYLRFYADEEIKRFREKWSENIMEDQIISKGRIKIGVQ